MVTEPIRYLYRIQPTRSDMLSGGPTADEAAVIEAHFQYLMALADAGTVRFIGRTLNVDESAFGIVVFDVYSEEAARGVMDADPAVVAGVMRAELFPFRTVFPSDTSGPGR